MPDTLKLRARAKELPDKASASFAAAIFELGLKHSSPKVLMKLMPPKANSLTTEHIKSRLQKYRLHAHRSKVGDIRDLGAQCVREQLYLQEVLRQHISAQLKLQAEIHEHLTTAAAAPSPLDGSNSEVFNEEQAVEGKGGEEAAR
ncbi:conserved unknown protein [Ectocarpus siliculosus]|uniref:Uncharacterized protein n=1 Tax=Ectocarpus siliculosus TaxID=2880 RepID=D7FMP1_ECTSI|nr:conserved unknown protein [Ectocarpus siliculosus]|eukprot:CBJ25938.1 conserved unknown protein [Ectocarpus siliculosus]